MGYKEDREKYIEDSEKNRAEWGPYVQSLYEPIAQGKIGTDFSFGNLEDSSEDILWWLGGNEQAGGTEEYARSSSFMKHIQSMGFSDPKTFMDALRARATERKGLSQDLSLKPGQQTQTTNTANIRNLLS